MKGLTLTQPWASEMAEEWKHYETRSWPTSYRGLLAIHAAKGFPGWAKRFASTEVALKRVPSHMPIGQIIAVVRVVGCHRTEDVALDVSALERYLGDYDFGRFAFETEFVGKLAQPIPFTGALGLWTVPPAVEAGIMADLGGEVQPSEVAAAGQAALLRGP